MEFSHISVLLNECIEALDIKPDGIYVDGTAGGAGHSSEIAKKLASGRLVAIDKDPDAVQTATERLAPYTCAQVVRGDYSSVKEILASLKIEHINGMLLDLGVSSYQLDTAERGFSFHKDAPLDMRMSREGLSAKDIVNTYSYEQLAKILWEYGEERFSRRIADAIVQSRAVKPIETTFELVDIIKSAMPAAAMREGHPARRSFQALRIAVNGELEQLAEAVNDAFDLLAPGGRLCIITFHSLEDRIVKQRFVEFTKGCTCPPDFPVCVCHKTPRGRLVYKKPIEPSQQELDQNPRSRSARLRVIEKL
ncbi:16S rRNA (cytosine(1402)-N(4))-methyltransferase RsmH [Acetanaerobacterium elongatum]|uniref:Ribosomal RNA small subunit methyltransferase H n=1 Tax=Acetanaerobacterium elongatum TaxID=258515 RepID=A0A1G9VJ95_9FIRM|nr:16S rRNA (cytosine(1402)-N(4))-methyltransferase RsmH [Acetanaerobacterium elongatum]SDM72111.1 16S rRNA (cytosine1402-N4)-methyltransferase [Acetanaerobacterium elongatum]